MRGHDTDTNVPKLDRIAVVPPVKKSGVTKVHFARRHLPFNPLHSPCANVRGLHVKHREVPNGRDLRNHLDTSDDPFWSVRWLIRIVELTEDQALEQGMLDVDELMPAVVQRLEVCVPNMAVALTVIQ